jgi:hypothetical protein
VKIAPHQFGRAANLVALLSLVPLGRGWFVVTYQTSLIENKRRWFVTLASTAGILFLATTPFLIPPLGAYGACLAGVIAFYVPSTIYLFLSQHGKSPLPLPWRQILGGPLAAGALLTGFLEIRGLVGVQRIGLGVLALIAYPALLLLIGAIPRGPLRSLAHPVALIDRWKRNRKRLDERVAALDTSDRQLLHELLRVGRRPGDVAAERGEQELTVLTRFGVIIRSAAEIHEGPIPTVKTARYLLYRGTVAGKHSLGMHLIDDGADPFALDRMEETVRRLRRKHWDRVPSLPRAGTPELPALARPNIAR